jgi:putative acetyltransferase
MQSMKSTLSACIEILKDSHLAQVLGVISSVRGELGLSHRVPSLLEPADLNLLDVYQHPRSCYFVATIDNNRVLGGAGIFPLAGADSVTCELQRMYLCSEYRGRGIGQALFNACIGFAQSKGFDRCYAETISEMTGAIAFYRRNGFRKLKAPIGQTNHGHNDYWLVLEMTHTPVGT